MKVSKGIRVGGLMRKLIIAATVGGAFMVPATASAAPIKECGGVTSGAGIYNVTMRNWGYANCAFARGFAQRANSDGSARQWARRYRGRPWSVYFARTWVRCRVLDHAWEYVDIRCTGPRGFVLRWQSGA